MDNEIALSITVHTTTTISDIRKGYSTKQRSRNPYRHRLLPLSNTRQARSKHPNQYNLRHRGSNINATRRLLTRMDKSTRMFAYLNGMLLGAIRIQPEDWRISRDPNPGFTRNNKGYNPRMHTNP